MTRLKRLLRFSVAALTAAASLGIAVGQAAVEDESASGNALISRLQGTGLVLSNPSLTAGAPTQFGLFTSGASAGLSIDEGIAINTGSVLDQFGPNNADSSSIAGGGVFSDPDLTAIDGAAVNDVAILEFDITLDDPATGFAFNYQFGSEEYPDFVGSGFNDLVAFFVTGPGLPAAQNFALSPNGSRVRINNINAGVVGCSADGTTTDLTQSSAYINNGHVTALPGTCQTGAALPGPSPIITEYNGVTQLLTARASGLIAGQTYRMKIAIADVGDNQYDSGIFMDLVSAVFQPDFGDAPNTGGFGDPSHAIDSALRLGTSISGEDAGFNTADASGDLDDGVTIPNLVIGLSSNVVVDVQGAGGRLQAWFDWNDDGDFNDSGEQVAVDVQDVDSDGQIILPVTPPASAASGEIIARFRWSTQAGLNATSAAPNGEVEDYAVRVISSSSLPTCPAGLTLSAAPGFADSVFSETSVSNSERALGALETAGTTPPDAFAAELNTGSDDLVLDFGAIIPENATITFSVARDNGGSGDFAFARILLSADGSSFTDLGIYGPPFITLPYVSSAQNVIEQFTLTVPSGGAQFIRFDPLTNDDIFVDGASYDFSCAARPELRANKVATVFDPDGLGLYALPGNDVVYTITVSNAGGGATDVNSVDLIDRLPDEVEFFNGAFDTTDPTSGPVEFVDSSSGLTFDENNDVAFSDDASRPANFADCTYAPAVGYDPAVSFICFNPKGALGAGDPDPAFSVSFRARIK